MNNPFRSYRDFRQALELGRELMSFGSEVASFTMSMARLIHGGADGDTVVELVRAREAKAGEAGWLAAKAAGPSTR